MQRTPIFLLVLLIAGVAAYLFGSARVQVQVTTSPETAPVAASEEAPMPAPQEAPQNPDPEQVGPEAPEHMASPDDEGRPLLHPYQKIIRAAPGVKPIPEDGPKLVEMPDGSKWPPLNGVRTPIRLNWPVDQPYYPPVGVVRNQAGVDWYVHADGNHSTTFMASNKGGPVQAAGMVQRRDPRMEAKDLPVRPGSAGVPSNRLVPPPDVNQSGGGR